VISKFSLGVGNGDFATIKSAGHSGVPPLGHRRPESASHSTSPRAFINHSTTNQFLEQTVIFDAPTRIIFHTQSCKSHAISHRAILRQRGIATVIPSFLRLLPDPPFTEASTPSYKMSLLDLSPELLLLIASQVHQVDLLNVSLVCKHLHCVVEPELYREYSNPRLHVRPFLPFIKKLIARPELAKHVRKVDLHAWDSLDIFEPIPNEQGPGRDRDMEAIREHELSQEDYYLAAEAAKTAGVIGAIDPYEPSSRLIDTAKSLGNTDDELHPCK
jgi:hypothetical protein